MRFVARYGVKLRKLALAGVVVAASATYVLSQSGRPPVALPTATTAAAAAPASQVRLGTRQVVKVKDGEFKGSKYDTRFGYVRVRVTFEDGRIVAIKSEEYPDHSPTSVRINVDALPKLEQEVITAQSAEVDVVSGATLTSKAWAKSVRSAIRAAARS